jgi:hypothetical protein
MMIMEIKFLYSDQTLLATLCFWFHKPRTLGWCIVLLSHKTDTRVMKMRTGTRGAGGGGKGIFIYGRELFPE